jgi:hypothetical protein
MDVKIEGSVDSAGEIHALQPVFQTGANLNWIPSTVQPKLVLQDTNHGWRWL